MIEDQNPLCPACGEPIPPKGKTGPRKKFCSMRCRQRVNKDIALARERDARARARRDTRLKCPTCLSEFVAAHRIDQVYCSPECRPEGAKHSLSQTCEVEDCDRPRQGRGLCQMHYRRDARAAGREKNPEWDDRAKRNYDTRRGRLDGGRNSDPKMLRDLIEHGDHICPECGKEIDLTLSFPHPMYRTIDHKIPLAKGGKHILSNCQLMHYQCNAAKGVRLSAKA